MNFFSLREVASYLDKFLRGPDLLQTSECTKSLYPIASNNLLKKRTRKVFATSVSSCRETSPPPNRTFRSIAGVCPLQRCNHIRNGLPMFPQSQACALSCCYPRKSHRHKSSGKEIAVSMFLMRELPLRSQRDRCVHGILNRRL